MSALGYLAAWRSLSGRIQGLGRAATVHAGFLAINSASPYGADKALQNHCEGIRAGIEQFQMAFQDVLPAATIAAIERFMADGGKQIADNSAGDARLVRTIIVKLVAFEAEVSYHLDSQVERVRSTSELAFMHLQRLIAADEDYRRKWQVAWGAHETHCEKLGALHLLWHGVWAFKADATGGKTDLIYQEPLQIDAAPRVLGVGRRGIGKPPIFSRSDTKAGRASCGCR